MTFYTQYFVTFCILSSLLLLSLKKTKIGLRRSSCTEVAIIQAESIPWHSDPPWWFIPGNHRLLVLSKSRCAGSNRVTDKHSVCLKMDDTSKWLKKWEGDFLHQICDRNHINHREPWNQGPCSDPHLSHQCGLDSGVDLIWWPPWHSSSPKPWKSNRFF